MGLLRFRSRSCFVQLLRLPVLLVFLLGLLPSRVQASGEVYIVFDRTGSGLSDIWISYGVGIYAQTADHIEAAGVPDAEGRVPGVYRQTIQNYNVITHGWVNGISTSANASASTAVWLTLDVLPDGTAALASYETMNPDEELGHATITVDPNPMLGFDPPAQTAPVFLFNTIEFDLLDMVFSGDLMRSLGPSTWHYSKVRTVPGSSSRLTIRAGDGRIPSVLVDPEMKGVFLNSISIPETIGYIPTWAGQDGSIWTKPGPLPWQSFLRAGTERAVRPLDVGAVPPGVETLEGYGQLAGGRNGPPQTKGLVIAPPQQVGTAAEVTGWKQSGSAAYKFERTWPKPEWEFERTVHPKFPVIGGKPAKGKGAVKVAFETELAGAAGSPQARPGLRGRADGRWRVRQADPGGQGRRQLDALGHDRAGRRGQAGGRAGPDQRVRRLRPIPDGQAGRRRHRPQRVDGKISQRRRPGSASS